MSAEEEVGVISHFYTRLGVAVVEVTAGSFRVGDTLRFRGSTTDFTQSLESMEIERKKIQTAKKGDSVGIKVKDRVREGDRVYKIS